MSPWTVSRRIVLHLIALGAMSARELSEVQGESAYRLTRIMFMLVQRELLIVVGRRREGRRGRESIIYDVTNKGMIYYGFPLES